MRSCRRKKEQHKERKKEMSERKGKGKVRPITDHEGTEVE
jgi:hypothetical protein